MPQAAITHLGSSFSTCRNAASASLNSKECNKAIPESNVSHDSGRIRRECPVRIEFNAIERYVRAARQLPQGGAHSHTRIEYADRVCGKLQQIAEAHSFWLGERVITQFDSADISHIVTFTLHAPKFAFAGS